MNNPLTHFAVNVFIKKTFIKARERFGIPPRTQNYESFDVSETSSTNHEFIFIKNMPFC